jgi:uncharacterized protein YbjQ (UPF0145 family)
VEDFASILSACLVWGVPIALVVVGFGVGRAVERAHFRDLARREEALREIVATTLRTAPAGLPVASGELVAGSVVIGSDYFKTLAAGLRKLVGGEVRSFERMMERARREACCRMLEQARSRGARVVINVRFETSSIGGLGAQQMPMAEVIAYGTALIEPGPTQAFPKAA